MKKIALVVLATVALPTTAHAEAFSGPYVGLEGGFDSFELKGEAVDFGGADVTLDGLSGSGLVGGINAGWDVSFGSGFAGIEGFASLSRADMTAGFDDGVDSYSVDAKAKESYGVAVRAGMKVNPSTGAYARLGWVNTNFEVGETDNGTRFSDDAFEDGIQYGAGIETVVGRNVALRLEYTRTDYGSGGLGDGINLKNSQARVGFGYRF